MCQNVGQLRTVEAKTSNVREQSNPKLRQDGPRNLKIYAGFVKT